MFKIKLEQLNKKGINEAISAIYTHKGFPGKVAKRVQKLCAQAEVHWAACDKKITAKAKELGGNPNENGWGFKDAAKKKEFEAWFGDTMGAEVELNCAKIAESDLEGVALSPKDWGLLKPFIDVG